MFLFYCSNSPMLKLVREQLHLQGPDFEIKSTDVITFIVWFDYHYIMNKWDNKNSKSYYDKQYKTNSNNNCAYRFLLLTSSRFWTKWFYSWHLHFFVFLLQVFFFGQKMKGNLYWIKKTQCKTIRCKKFEIHSVQNVTNAWFTSKWNKTRHIDLWTKEHWPSDLLITTSSNML